MVDITFIDCDACAVYTPIFAAAESLYLECRLPYISFISEYLKPKVSINIKERVRDLKGYWFRI